MAVEIQINGTALNPQPRTGDWRPFIQGGKLDGTDGTGAYRTLVLRSPNSRGGTANFNWEDFENSVLTSIQAFPPGETMKNGSATTYNSGVVSKPIKTLRSQPGDIVPPVEFVINVVV